MSHGATWTEGYHGAVSDSLPLVFCFDESFVKFAAVAASSALLNDPECTKIYWVFPEEAGPEALRMKTRLRSNAHKVTLVPVNDLPFQNWKEFDHISWATYLRLLIQDSIDENKVLYLDSDVLVLGTLAGLRSQDIGDALIAGARDHVAEVSTKIVRVDGDPYINAGVMILNLGAMRGHRLLDTAKHLYREYQSQIVWPSQDLMNKYAEGRKIVIPSRWNEQVFCQISAPGASAELNRARGASVVHFVGGTKPWSIFCDPKIAKLWWRYGKKIGGWQLRIGRAAQVLIGRPVIAASKVVRNAEDAVKSVKGR